MNGNEEINEDATRKVDCKTCGFYEAPLCKQPGCNVGLAVTYNTPKIEETAMFGKVDVGSCRYHTTPDAARIIRAEGIMKCVDCIHHDTVRGFQLCFVDGGPWEPYNPIGIAEFRKEPYEMQVDMREESYGVCEKYIRR